MSHEHDWKPVDRPHEDANRIRTWDRCACGAERWGCFAKRLSSTPDSTGNLEWWGPVGVWSYTVEELKHRLAGGGVIAMTGGRRAGMSTVAASAAMRAWIAAEVPAGEDSSTVRALRRQVDELRRALAFKLDHENDPAEARPRHTVALSARLQGVLADVASPDPETLLLAKSMMGEAVTREAQALAMDRLALEPDASRIGRSRVARLLTIADETPSRPGMTFSNTGRLRAAIAALPPLERRLVIACWLRGMTQREAARDVGIAQPSVSARLDRATMRLRLFCLAPPSVAHMTLIVGPVLDVEEIGIAVGFWASGLSKSGTARLLRLDRRALTERLLRIERRLMASSSRAARSYGTVLAIVRKDRSWGIGHDGDPRAVRERRASLDAPSTVTRSEQMALPGVTR